MKVAVIGGGAAGMMCAAIINKQNPKIDVLLFEKNTVLGKKVLISGGGRCNVTTGVEDIKTVITKYPRGGKFLTSALYHFPPQSVWEWFEAEGVPLKCEDDLRVFPVSDKGGDVVGVFQKIFDAGSTTVLFKHGVTSILKLDNKFKIQASNQEFIVDAVIIALGGQAYRFTGSTGDGYTLAEKLGHTITPLAPSLHSYITAQKWPRQLAGVSFERASVNAKGSQNYSFTGPILFTHHGITGPAVFAVSSLSAYEEFNPKNPLPLFVDILPDTSHDTLRSELKKLCLDNPKKSFKNTIHAFMPSSVALVACTENGIDAEKKNGEVTNGEIEKIMQWIKKIPLFAVGRGAGDEFVTAGGINLSEVDPRTMESKLVKNLYFAGEILDIDGFTGGFNLQASWSTGHLAGESIARLSS